tara:strand:+ start:562 stop:1737 length:1176 start_codon:yes stop_codon:yes gene_type:complete
MLINFFNTVKRSGVPVSIKELLDLINAMDKNLSFGSTDEFYLLARLCMVKDERYFDRFDRAFGAYFKNLQDIDQILELLIPEEWLKKEFEKHFTDEEKAKIESLGGLEKLIEEFKKRLEEQSERHQGGNKWIGTGGTSPFGHGGYNPEGIRIGGPGGSGSAVKVWDERQYRDLDGSIEIGTRNIKIALRRLRRFAREGAPDFLDLGDTIRSTARNAGLLDLKMIPERRNSVKVLIFFDVGGSMDPFVTLCEELFSAAKTEFKHMEYFYFHNCLYDYVWKENRRRKDQQIKTHDLLNKYSSDYKVIFVGDASMAPYEISSPGGSVEYQNEESGMVWMQRVASTYNKVIWINPVEENYWHYTPSISMLRRLVEDRMYPLTLDGLERGMEALSR